MSLIFKSLKKLKEQSSGVEKVTKPEAGNVYTFRKLLFSPQAFILLFILILIAGLVTTRSYQFIRNTFFVKKEIIANETSKKNTDLESFTNKASQKSTPVRPMVNEESIPPAPEKIPVTNVKPGKFTFPLAATQKTGSSQKNTDADSSLTPGTLPEQPFATSFLPPKQYNESEYFQQQPGKTSIPEPVSNAKIESQAEKQRLKKINQQSKITQLVSKIERSLREQNLKKTETLINKLVDIRGDNNKYVLRLTAYLLIQKKDYRKAEHILEKILTENSTDLNAGINMAVIEAGTGRLSSAQDRLKRLSELFPENSEIYELMERFQ